MKHLVVASTSYQLLCLAAAADHGVFDGGERVLVLADGSQLPELTTPLPEVAGYDQLVARFDRVVDLAGLIAPRRPAQFSPRGEELTMWEALLRSHWGLGEEPVTLWLDAIQVNPGLALARVFFDADLNAHADGLMAYGPTRSRLPLAVRQRVGTLLHVDLVPGLRPLMLHEASPALTALPVSRLRAVIDEVGRSVGAEDAARVQAFVGAAGERSGEEPRTALILGQYLTKLELLTTEEEDELHRDMVTAAREAGATHCVFKPHPAAGPALAEALTAHADALDLPLLVLNSPVQAELLFAALRPHLVVSAFSTGLATADTVFGLDARAVGTARLLDRLQPYQNSNRVPLTLVDALYAGDLPAPAAAPDDLPPRRRLQLLLHAVAYCMQSQNLDDLRHDAVSYLTDARGNPEMRFFKKRRILALGLPGVRPPGRLDGLPLPVRRVVRRGVRVWRRSTAGRAPF
ncbi:polysialyltransferase family glycosyltransferase [Auraticoccus monumenti]|uniref:Uncharacterized protein n=1 Tax=Auraticoccus monumenti TaxID=675864 RepID=A0A1G7EPY0_9ACTN|nr:polysialyltransferase family glycosyltransferase [Auraticoccus monumenti]SDE65679.1 hypothetical protein SAMN04489747_4008 [Auraticoccus monumenti]